MFFLIALLSTNNAQYTIDDFTGNWKDNFEFPVSGFDYEEQHSGIVYQHENRHGTIIYLLSTVQDSAHWHIEYSCNQMSSGGYMRYYVVSDEYNLLASNSIFIECINTDNRIRLCEQKSGGEVSEILSSPPLEPHNSRINIQLNRTCGGLWTIKCSSNENTLYQRDTLWHPAVDAQYSGIRVTMDNTKPSLISIHSMSAAGVKKCGDPEPDDPKPPIDPDTIPESTQTKHSIVITEIMADPEPSAGLPEVEYVEIYNRTDHAIDLTNCQLCVGTACGNLYPYTLQAGEYAVMCSENKIIDMADYENLLPVQLFKTLINGGRVVYLKDAEGSLMTWTDYTIDWYSAGELKSEGGYSLERRDINNLHISPTNFQASEHTNGGTPGAPNSVACKFEDNVQPKVLAAYLEGNQTLCLIFNKEMIMSNANFQLSSEIAQTSFEYPQNRAVRFELTAPIDSSVSIHLSNLRCVSDFTLADTLIEVFKLHIPQRGDIVVSELMFNPDTDKTKYIELCNISNKHLSLEQLQIDALDSYGENKKSLKITNAHTHALAPNSYALLITDPFAFQHSYTYCHDAQLCHIETELLDVDGGGIVLCLAHNAQMLDSIHYAENMHNAWLSETKGVSLENTNLLAQEHSIDNWTSAASIANFATPGCANSHTESTHTPENTTKHHFYTTLESFTPNNDAYEDVLDIHYDLPNNGYQCRVELFTPSGNHLLTLVNNELIPQTGKFQWQGTDNDGSPLPVGIYVIVIHATHPDGDKIHERLVAVIAS